MANCILAYPNRADECTLSGGSWSAGLPLANLQSRFLGVPARSANLALPSTLFSAQLLRQRLVRVIALVAHNLSSAARYRVRAWSDVARTDLTVDTDWQWVWPAIYPPEVLEWEYDYWWDGTMLEEDRVGFTWTLPIVLQQPVLAQSLQVELEDSSNGAGYVEIGRLFIAGEWQPAMNLAWGSSLGYETGTQVAESLAGVEHFDERRPYRVARIAIEHMVPDEGLARPFDMQRLLGISREVFFMYDPNDSVHLLRRSFLARLRQLSPLEFPYFNNTRSTFELKELL